MGFVQPKEPQKAQEESTKRGLSGMNFHYEFHMPSIRKRNECQ